MQWGAVTSLYLSDTKRNDTSHSNSSHSNSSSVSSHPHTNSLRLIPSQRLNRINGGAKRGGAQPRGPPVGPRRRGGGAPQGRGDRIHQTLIRGGQGGA